MSKTLDILIRINQAGGGAFDKTARGIKKINLVSKEYKRTLTDLNGTTDSFTSSIGKMVAAIGGADLFRRFVTAGFSFNDTIEKSQIGIASLIRTFNDFETAQGQAVSANEKYAKSMEMARTIQKSLQIEGLKTTATYEQLLVALQEGIGPAFKAGFDSKQVVKFTSSMVQAAAALSMPMDQLGQELRSILEGTIDRNSRVAKALGITNAKVKELTESGKLFDYLNGKLKEFAVAGEATAKTFSGAWSNVVDAVQMAIGKGLENSFKSTTKMFLELKDAIVTVDESAGTFEFNPAITEAIQKVDNAISGIIGESENFDQFIVNITNAFADVTVAILKAVNALLDITSAMGPFLPVIAKAVTYMLLLKTALLALVGLPMSIASHFIALGNALRALALSKLVASFGGFRAALAAVTAQTTALSLAFKGFIAFAAAQGIYNIVRLGKAIWDWRDAVDHAKESMDNLHRTTAAIIEKYKDFRDVKIPDNITGKSVQELSDLNSTLLKSKAYWTALYTDVTTISKETNWLGNPTEEAKAAMAVFDAVTARYNKIVAASKEVRAALGGVVTKSKVDDGGGMTDDQRKKIASEQKQLEEQLARELIEISGDKWTVLRNKARAHYEDELALANGRKDLILNAEKVYHAELARIRDAQGKEILDKEKTQSAAQVRSQTERFREMAQTALAKLQATSGRAGVSLEEYFAKRRDIIEKQYAYETGQLTRQLNTETDEGEKLRIEDQLFALKEQHTRDLIALNDEELLAQQTLADKKMAVENMLADMRLRTRKEMSSALNAQFSEELASMDQRHNEEIDRLKDLKAEKEAIDEAYRLQKMEKDQLMADQEKRLAEYRLNIASSLAGSLSDIFSSLYDATGKRNKELFYLSKAAAIAEATITAYAAANKALLEGGAILGKIQAAVILATGMANVAKIQAQTLATGGEVLGYSPTDKADNVPIWATAGEFMQPVAAVKYYGREVMEAIRRRIIPRDFFSGIKIPSLPSPSSFALASGGMPQAAPAQTVVSKQPINILNVTDPVESLANALGTPEGQNVIFNFMSSRSETVKRVLA